jgi:hypothetical protein
LGDKKVLGKIVEVNGNYVLQTSGIKKAGKAETIQVGTAADKDKYAKLVGQEVEVILSEPTQSVVGILGKAIRIICYIPPVNYMQSADWNIIKPIVAQLVSQGILSQANADKIAAASQTE